MVKIFLIIFFSVSLTACVVMNTKNGSLRVTNIVASGYDGVSSEFCASFSLTKDEAQYYFDNAKQVSARDIHDNYSFLPCYVSGEANLNNQICEWEVRAGGTSHITCGNQSMLMGCEDCLPTQK